MLWVRFRVFAPTRVAEIVSCGTYQFDSDGLVRPARSRDFKAEYEALHCVLFLTHAFMTRKFVRRALQHAFSLKTDSVTFFRVRLVHTPCSLSAPLFLRLSTKWLLSITINCMMPWTNALLLHRHLRLVIR